MESVEAFNQLTFEKRIFANKECKYSYRHSFFKEDDHDPYIVTYVNLRLQKNPGYKLDYGNLRSVLKDTDLSVQAVRNAVIDIRHNKLPGPDELGNAGSYFMNPVVTGAQFNGLKEKYPEMPFYSLSDGHVKVPAGWLIEQCGFRGRRQGHVGVYEKQALIIINHGGATGTEIAEFAENILQTVNDKFGIMLIPEVKYVH